MNREIKYRVWVYQEKAYNKYPYWADVESGSVFRMGNCIDYELTNFCVQQLTGLKDKNNKSIYEGDIIQLTNGRKYPVVWDAFYFDLENYDNYTRENQFSAFCNLMPEEIEVIGNIFETPDLLSTF